MPEILESLTEHAIGNVVGALAQNATAIDADVQGAIVEALRLGDPNAYSCPAKIAIGSNEAARVTGTLREDKKARGTVHIGVGTNSEIGGTITARTHIDGLLRRPSVSIDGRAIIDSGRLLVEAGR